jgi:hypothetical protein
MTTKLTDFETETRNLTIEQLLADIEAEEEDIPLNGTCPYASHCEMRRARLSHYRPDQPCHWLAWGDWQRCPIFRNKI